MNDKRPSDLRERTTDFALRVIRFYMKLPKTTEAQILGKQVLRSGTSVGAHYREGSRARSRAEFISKLEGGLQKLDETIYWLELLDRPFAGTPKRARGSQRANFNLCDCHQNRQRKPRQSSAQKHFCILTSNF